MRIAYTVNGEGMGHATRSSVVIDHLLQQGHELKIFCGGTKQVDFLRERFGDVAGVTSLHIVYKNNKVRRLQTAARVLGSANQIRKDHALIKETLRGFDPELVITDFDFHGEIISRTHKIPLISVDNIQYMTKAQVRVSSEDFMDFELNYMIAKMMVPRAYEYIITTFTPKPKVKRKYANTVKFVAPLLRQKILNAKVTQGEHVLVYQTSKSYTRMFSILESVSDQQFIVYNATSPRSISNVVCKSFSESSFIADLASAKAVIVNGGFTVISESVFFKKPILSIPVRNHFEQRLNGQLLQEAGYGLALEKLSQKRLVQFLSDLDLYKAALDAHTMDTKEALVALDETIARIAKS